MVCNGTTLITHLHFSFSLPQQALASAQLDRERERERERESDAAVPQKQQQAVSACLLPSVSHLNYGASKLLIVGFAVPAQNGLSIDT